jgi:hypothetical protein
MVTLAGHTGTVAPVALLASLMDWVEALTAKMIVSAERGWSGVTPLGVLVRLLPIQRAPGDRQASASAAPCQHRMCRTAMHSSLRPAGRSSFVQPAGLMSLAAGGETDHALVAAALREVWLLFVEDGTFADAVTLWPCIIGVPVQWQVVARNVEATMLATNLIIILVAGSVHHSLTQRPR